MAPNVFVISTQIWGFGGAWWNGHSGCGTAAEERKERVFPLALLVKGPEAPGSLLKAGSWAPAQVPVLGRPGWTWESPCLTSSPGEFI